jgi:hypothetical protein
VVFVSSYFTAVIVLVAYSATFISFLAVRRTVLPFTDFKGLLNDGTYKLGVFPNSAQMYYFEVSSTESPSSDGALFFFSKINDKYVYRTVHSKVMSTLLDGTFIDCSVCVAICP